MLESSSPYLTGRLLVAMPGIGDPRFERAVVLLCAHNAEHALGLAINRPIEGTTVPELLKRLGVESSIELPQDLVRMGGPVERARGFVIHTDDYRCEESSIDVGPGLLLTGTREVLEALASHNRRPKKSIMALGYAGWGPGQLETEIRENVWLTCDPDDELVFGDDHDHKWAQALAKLGVSAERLSSQAGRA